MSCTQFIIQSFAVRDAAHLAHLTSRSYSEHMALDTFYNAILDLTDKFAEVYTGLTGKIPKYPPLKPLDYDDTVELLEDYLALVKEEQGDGDDDAKEADGDADDSQALLNILAEMEELTAQTLYKLKFLK